MAPALTVCGVGRQARTSSIRSRRATRSFAIAPVVILLGVALPAGCRARGEDRPAVAAAGNGPIAFVRSTGRVARVLIVDPSGGRPRPFGPREGTVGDPAWSPDGSRLAVAWRRWPDGFGISIVDGRGRELRALTGGRWIDASPTWSPDASTLAFSRVRGARAIVYVIPARGGRPRPLVAGRAPDWSPRDDVLAFERAAPVASDLFTYRPVEGELEVVVSGPADDRDPDWSPDGTRLAFASDRDGDFDLYVLDLGAGRIRRLTDDPGDERWPEWSPDGRMIAFVRVLPESSSIWLVGADGSGERRVTTGPWDSAPAWRPIP